MNQVLTEHYAVPTPLVWNPYSYSARPNTIAPGIRTLAAKVMPSGNPVAAATAFEEEELGGGALLLLGGALEVEVVVRVEVIVEEEVVVTTATEVRLCEVVTTTTGVVELIAKAVRVEVRSVVFAAGTTVVLGATETVGTNVDVVDSAVLTATLKTGTNAPPVQV